MIFVATHKLCIHSKRYHFHFHPHINFAVGAPPSGKSWIRHCFPNLMCNYNGTKVIIFFDLLRYSMYKHINFVSIRSVVAFAPTQFDPYRKILSILYFFSLKGLFTCSVFLLCFINKLITQRFSDRIIGESCGKKLLFLKNT